MRRILIIVAAIVALLAAVAGVLVVTLRHPLPEGAAGPDGDELARKVSAAVGADAWEKLGAVKWTMAGRNHYLWDKRRGFVRFSSGDDEVLLDLMKIDGRAFHAGEELSGEAKKKLIDKAYALFCNDSFWLNPLVKLFDSGTTRARVDVDGKPALLIAYASGGVTPGDKYLWLLDDNGSPRAWRVWASVLKPVPGVEFTWEDWVDVGGARISTLHRVMGIKVQPLSDLGGAERPDQLEPGPDPFAGLAQKR